MWTLLSIRDISWIGEVIPADKVIADVNDSAWIHSAALLVKFLENLVCGMIHLSL